MLVAALLVAGSAAAESPMGGLPLRSTLPDESAASSGEAEPEPAEASPRACGSRDALYGSGPQKIWVTRLGTMRWQNALRPMAADSVWVVQVAVNGQAGSAFGPDFENLQQGDASAVLGGAEAIRWSASLGEVPAELRIVADDGRVLVGPLAFANCGDAPKVARAPLRPAKRTTPAEPRETSGPGGPATPSTARPVRRDSAPPGFSIPQGAIR